MTQQEIFSMIKFLNDFDLTRQILTFKEQKDANMEEGALEMLLGKFLGGRLCLRFYYDGGADENERTS